MIYKMVELYTEKGPRIFRGQRLRSLQRLVRRKYNSSPLELALKEVFGDRVSCQVANSLDYGQMPLCSVARRHLRNATT